MPGINAAVALADAARSAIRLVDVAGLVREARKDTASQHGSSADSKVEKRISAKAAALAVKGVTLSGIAPAVADGLSRSQRRVALAAAQRRLAHSNVAVPRGGECS